MVATETEATLHSGRPSGAVHGLSDLKPHGKVDMFQGAYLSSPMELREFNGQSMHIHGKPSAIGHLDYHDSGSLMVSNLEVCRSGSDMVDCQISYCHKQNPGWTIEYSTEITRRSLD
jgi:hypothetical protein